MYEKNCIKWVSWLIFVVIKAIIAIVITFIYVDRYT